MPHYYRHAGEQHEPHEDDDEADDLCCGNLGGEPVEGREEQGLLLQVQGYVVAFEEGGADLVLVCLVAQLQEIGCDLAFLVVLVPEVVQADVEGDLLVEAKADEGEGLVDGRDVGALQLRGGCGKGALYLLGLEAGLEVLFEGGGEDDVLGLDRQLGGEGGVGDVEVLPFVVFLLPY